MKEWKRKLLQEKEERVQAEELRKEQEEQRLLEEEKAKLLKEKDEEEERIKEENRRIKEVVYDKTGKVKNTINTVIDDESDVFYDYYSDSLVNFLAIKETRLDSKGRTFIESIFDGCKLIPRFFVRPSCFHLGNHFCNCEKILLPANICFGAGETFISAGIATNLCNSSNSGCSVGSEI